MSKPYKHRRHNNPEISHNVSQVTSQEPSYQAHEITIAPSQSIEHILLQQIHQLQNENLKLRTDILNLSKNEDILNEIIKGNKLTIEGNEKTIETLRKENEALKLKLKELEDKFKKLNDEHNKLNDDHKELKIKHQEQFDILSKKIEELEKRDMPITVREGFIALEKHIMLEICGSKSKARSFHDVKELFNSKEPSYQQKCSDYLTKYGITVDHIFIIAEIKDKGNKSAHDYRPDMKRIEWDNMAILMLDDPNDKDDVALTKDLLILMEKYIKVGSDGVWNVNNKPF